LRNSLWDYASFGAGAWCLILLLSLCTNTWAAGPPSLQIAHDPQSPLHRHSKQRPKIAIIIDDIGYNHARGQRAIELPGSVTLSILPHSPYGQQLAKLADRQGKEVMLHAPMSNILDKPLDPGALTSGMTKTRFIATLEAGLADLPFVSGVNNHMGSELTQQHQPMLWLMEALRQHELYFVDSRTIASSLAWETAIDCGIPTTRRDVFLDNEANYPAIAEQFGQLLAIAKRHGHAVAIAHPYPETLYFLETVLPMLGTAGYQLVPVSAVLSQPHLQTVKRTVDHPQEVVGLINH